MIPLFMFDVSHQEWCYFPNTPYGSDDEQIHDGLSYLLFGLSYLTYLRIYNDLNISNISWIPVAGAVAAAQ